MNFIELRKTYKSFVYKSYHLSETAKDLIITFNFEIPGLCSFNPKTTIPKQYITNPNIDPKFRDYLIFHIGLIEMISYYKCCCPKNIIIECGYLEQDQINFIKKLLYYGLGEFLYTNNISLDTDELVHITCSNSQDPGFSPIAPNYVGTGTLIPVGGGKDSCVSLEILKELNVTAVIQNPKKVQLECVKASKVTKLITFEREVQKEKLKELNQQGFLNGHTPFSSLLAFELYLIAYLSNNKYIALSNENSANEGTVIGTKINHQYSKTLEFEKDFNDYTQKYFKLDIKYFSFLRPLNEFQIAMLFSHYESYHHVFKSCNIGSLSHPWIWCGHCPKCLFVYIILSPFLYKDKLLNIFGSDLFIEEELLPTLKELLGETGVKPFECVGEVKEVKYALSLLVDKCTEPLPVLLKYYKDNYESATSLKLESQFSKAHLLPDEFLNLLKKELSKYVQKNN